MRHSALSNSIIIRLLIILIGLSVFSDSYSATYDLHKLGPTTWASPGWGTRAYSAMTGFRRFAGPIGALVTAGELITALKPMVMDNLQNQVAPFQVVPPGTAPPLDQQASPVHTYSMAQQGLSSSSLSGLQSLYDASLSVKGVEYCLPSGNFVVGQHITLSGGCGPPGDIIGDNISCRAGYQLQGDTCVLDQTGASGIPKWIDDQLMTLSHGSQNALVPHAYEGDPMPDFTNPMDPFVTQDSPGDTFKQSGHDEFGNPQERTVTTTTDGGTDVKILTQGTDTSGNPLIKRDYVRLNENGVVEQTDTTYIPGTLPQVSTQTQTTTTTTIPTTQPAPTVSDMPQPSTAPLPANRNNPTTGTLPPSNTTSPVPFVSPGTKPNEEPEHNETPAPAGQCSCPMNLVAPKAPSFEDSFKEFWNGLGNAPLFRALHFTVGSGQCQPFGFDFSGAGVFAALGHPTTSVHCDLLEQNRDKIAIFFILAFVLCGLFIILDA